MKAFLRDIRRYPLPITLVLFALMAASADPARPVSRSIPIALGAYQWHVVSILLLMACGAYAWLKRTAVDRLLDSDGHAECGRSDPRD